MPAWRRAAEQLNGILTNPISPSIQTDGDFVRTLRRLTAKCSTVSLLVIGPWTSFLRYAADLLPKVDRITVQGRPYPDEPGGEPAGFNCVYDIEPCRTSFDLLTGRQLRADRRLRVTVIGWTFQMEQSLAVQLSRVSMEAASVFSLFVQLTSGFTTSKGRARRPVQWLKF